MMQLTKKMLRDHKIGLTLVAFGLLLYDWFVAAIFPTFKDVKNIEELIKSYPETLKAFFGFKNVSLFTFEGFLNAEFLSFMWVVIVAGYLISFATSEVSKEIESGTIESLLSLPVSRLKIITTKWLNMAVICLFFVAVTVFPLMGLAAAYGIKFSALSLFLVGILGFMFFFSIASFTIMLTVLFNERSKPVFIVIFVLIVSWIWNSVGQIVESIKDLRFLSVFYYFDTIRALVEKEIGLGTIFVFSGIIVISTVFAFWWFSRRDFAV